MQMLGAGGWHVVTDSLRQPDADNPKGYYELEQVKELDKSSDKSWLYQHKGKAIKIVSHFLTHLPTDLNYKVIFILRDLDEILMSQKKMLRRISSPNEPCFDQSKIRNSPCATGLEFRYINDSNA